MIQMCMGEKYGINGMGINDERLPVSLLKLTFLIQPAINQKTSAFGLQQMSRTRYISGRTKKT